MNVYVHVYAYIYMYNRYYLVTLPYGQRPKNDTNVTRRKTAGCSSNRVR